MLGDLIQAGTGPRLFARCRQGLLSPQDWMSAAEYAVEGMADARAAAASAGPDLTKEQQAAAAASAALLMAEVRASFWGPAQLARGSAHHPCLRLPCSCAIFLCIWHGCFRY